ncbi:MAG: M23 family metallopeptidase [Gaiellaceae bacterium]
MRPFNRVHPIRGGFGDPRFGLRQRNFHFGIDISAPGGTPVYAVASGTVFLEPDHVDVLTHVSPVHASGFSYWHIVPVVAEHAAVRLHTLLGFVASRWGHVHFAEIEHGRWVNPLRARALTPAPAWMKPSIASVSVVQNCSTSEGADGFRGRITVVVDAFMRPQNPAPLPWQNSILAPAKIRWRLLQQNQPLSNWQTAVDFRDFIPDNTQYPDIYAPGTRPNHAGLPGAFLYYLACDWNIQTLPAGRYTIEVEAYGTHGATATATKVLEIARANPFIGRSTRR